LLGGKILCSRAGAIVMASGRAAEVFALRHHLAVLRQQAPSRARLHRLDRLVWVDLSRVWTVRKEPRT
jgi:hypothetical protein